MEKRPFPEKTKKPEAPNLKKELGRVYIVYEKLLEQTSSFKSEWNFYKSSGWILRIYDSKKALLYIVPQKNEIMISMTIRENERKAFLKDTELTFAHEDLKNSIKYPEGYAMRFNIRTQKQFKDLSLYADKLFSMR